MRVEGTLLQDTWEDRETGEPASRIEVQADGIDLDLARVEAITFRAKSDGEPTDPGRDPAHRRERAPSAAR